MSSTNASPSSSESLDVWLQWLETIHPVSIDMGLDRVSLVADRLALRPANKPLILVGGTNGKGSTVAMLTAIYCLAGYKVGAYTSPHIEHFCERIRCNGQMVEQSMVVDALAFIEQGRSPQTLTYFEYTTLAAMRIFRQLDCDVLLFEVGLGGRLDATNLWDADCSIITSVALDHEEYLGSDISVIATEKAAIGRAGKPLVVGQTKPPESLATFALANGFKLIDVGSLAPDSLPVTSMQGDYQRRNAACAQAAVDQLQTRLPVSSEVCKQALLDVAVAGRFEHVNMDGLSLVFDVAHNPAAAKALAQAWLSVYPEQRCQIIFASLCDKDIVGVVDSLTPIVDTWHLVALDVPRATSTQALAAAITPNVNAEQSVLQHKNARGAMHTIKQNLKVGDGPVLVAGSFYTIAAVKAAL